MEGFCVGVVVLVLCLQRVFLATASVVIAHVVASAITVGVLQLRKTRLNCFIVLIIIRLY